MMMIEHTKTQQMDSLPLKVLNSFNNGSWLMEVGTAALQMRNSSATELTSVTLEHGKSQSAQIFNTYKSLKIIKLYNNLKHKS